VNSIGVTYCEQYSKFLFIYLFAERCLLYFGFEIILIYIVTCKQSDVYYLEYKV